MVPELAAGAAAELTELRDAVTEAAASLPQRWVAIGVGPADDVFGPQRVGTFAGYGVDVRIALSPGTTDAPAQLPLCVLIAGWLRGQANPEARAEVRVYAADHDVDAALAHGRRLRAEIDEADDPVGVLVIADGAHTLTAPAPGGYNPASVPVQHAVDDVLARGHIAALTALPTNIVGRVAFQVLAGLAEPEARSCTEFYRGAPYGVGYFVGVWQP
ncbi:MAG: hypothetical protein QOC90_1082 [Mycobacterium sp.]|jgi:hypothetical protein|nr:hypothetical protein [Mycobacterium sp.]